MKPEEFVEKVTHAYQMGSGIFAEKKNAEDHLPSSASPSQKALFLFYVIQLDYQVKSQRLYEGARKLFEENPHFFTPDYILNFSEAELRQTLWQYLKPRFINEAVRRYKDNSRLLTDKYSSDPTNIFDAKMGNEVMARLKAFRGFGPKIGSFFFRTMVNTFSYDYTDLEKILPPVDVWDVRIAHMLEYVDSNDMSAKNVRKVQQLWQEACQKAGVSWLIFDKALWLLGSEGIPKDKSAILSYLYNHNKEYA